MNISRKSEYRPEIDGLRAIAVLAVVLFHAGFGCSGGYIGVDVFFVISGFLITSLIWKDLENGSYTFAQFWERRIRRIVPASVVMTIATLVAGWFLLLPPDFASLGRAAASRAVFASNIYSWRDSSYFAGAAEEKPLLHTWSLAVEEQFYLVIPLFLWAVFHFMAMRRQSVVISLLAGGFISSFALSIYGVEHFPSATFYFLPTRAWELLLGSIVAFLPLAPARQPRWNPREILSVTGILLVLIPIFLYTPETPVPGLAALPPCLGAALFIWSNGRNENGMPSFVGHLLSQRPLVFMGLISYSLYLWHWPFLAFSEYLAIAPLSAGYRAAMVGLGFLCAILSWKFVETPFRTRRIGTTRKTMFAFAGAGLATVLGCGLLSMRMQGFPLRIPPQARAFANSKSEMAFIKGMTAADIRAGNLVPIGVADGKLRPKVLVWGDSHAMAALPAIDALLKEKDLPGRAATHSSTAPVLNWFIHPRLGLEEESVAFNDAVLNYVRTHKIPEVVLSACWSAYVGRDGTNSVSFDSALLTTVRELRAAGARPWILLDVPNHSFNVPTALARSVVSPIDLKSFCAKPTVASRFDEIDPVTIAEIRRAGGQILDPKPKFLDPTGRHYIIQAKGIALYRDGAHLTPQGAKLMLLPFFRDSLRLEK